MSRRAILFDLDGTLVDTAPDLHASLNHALNSVGRPGVTLQHVRHMVGDGVRKLLERGLEASGGPIEVPLFEQAVADYMAHYELHLADLSYPFDGVKTVLQNLKDEGYRLGVCTNKPQHFSEKLLASLGLTPYFDAIVGGDRLKVRKPDGGHILGTLEAMAAKSGTALMVGDSKNDVAAARAAGIPVVVVSFGYTAIPPTALGADILIDHFHELQTAIAHLF